jgi:hypothetical protein
MPVIPKSLIEKILMRTRIENLYDCWIWVGGTNSWGYGSMWVSKTESRKAVHRVLYQLVFGPLPQEMLLHHDCENTRCVNPSHLRALTVKEHNHIHRPFDWIAAFHRAKTHCPHGHPYSPENTYLDHKGGRICRTCRGIQQRRYRARKRESEQANARSE